MFLGLGKTQYVRMSVELTASHMGVFEFRLCAKNSTNELVTQDCLNQNLLRLADGSTRYQVPDFTARWYDIVVKLPYGLTCNSCVVQWTYTTGKNSGIHISCYSTSISLVLIIDSRCR